MLTKMIRSEDIVQIISDGCPGLHVNIMDDIFPPRPEIDAWLDNLCPDPIHSSLAILDPLIPSASTFNDQPTSSHLYDERGYSSYARVISGLLHVFAQDRQIAKEHMWALRHFFALALYASDLQHIPWAQNSMFNLQAVKSGLKDMFSRIQQVATYLLTSSMDNGWGSTCIAALADDKPISSSDRITIFLTDLIRHARNVGGVREARILRNVLQHILDKADKDEADQWILLARKIESRSKQASLSRIIALMSFLIQAPKSPWQ
jgi:hypothetical protein